MTDKKGKNVGENVALLKSMVADGYGDSQCLLRRIAAMEAWMAAPQLLVRDADAVYAATLDIDLAAIREPLLTSTELTAISALKGAIPTVDEYFQVLAKKG